MFLDWEKLSLGREFEEKYKVSEHLRQVPHCRPSCPVLAELGFLLPSTSVTKHYLERAVSIVCSNLVVGDMLVPVLMSVELRPSRHVQGPPLCPRNLKSIDFKNPSIRFNSSSNLS